VRLALATLFAAVLLVDAACSGNGPCLGQCPGTYSLRFQVGGIGTGGSHQLDFSGPYDITVQADGRSESTSCTFPDGDAKPSCSPAPVHFRVDYPTTDGFFVRGVDDYPKNVSVSVQSPVGGTPVTATATNLTYQGDTNDCSCRTATNNPSVPTSLR